MGARERLPGGRENVLGGGGGRAPRGAADRRVQTAALGARGRAWGRWRMGMSSCCSGCAQTAAGGPHRPGVWRQTSGTSRATAVCLTNRPTVSLPIRTRTMMRRANKIFFSDTFADAQGAGPSRCCNGRTITAALNRSETYIFFPTYVGRRCKAASDDITETSSPPPPPSPFSKHPCSHQPPRCGANRCAP